MMCQCLCKDMCQKQHHLHAYCWFLSADVRDEPAHCHPKANEEGNLWCHLEGCGGTHTPYRVNIWGLRKTESNKKEGRQMLEQQVRNVLCHLKDAHQIEEHLVVKAILPKGTPPFPGRESSIT